MRPFVSIVLALTTLLLISSSVSAHVIPNPCDFVTGGGWIERPTGANAYFGVAGGCKNGAFWGHLNSIGHGLGYHVKGTQVTGYLDPFPPSSTRDICGTATTNRGENVFYRVRVTDNGEPGRDDTFIIRLSNGYTTEFDPDHTLGGSGPGGGNIQLHKPNPSTTGPSPAPDEFTMCHGL